MIRHLSFIMLALVASAWSLPTVQAEPTLHLLLVGDVGDPNLSAAIAANQSQVRQTVFGLVPSSQLQVIDWNPKEPDETVTASGTRLKQSLNELRQGNPQAMPQPIRRFQSGDSVLVYYIGHGEYEIQDREHILKYSSGPIKRSEVESTLRKSFPGAQLVMLITDSCATAVAPKMKYAQVRQVEILSQGIHRLFFAAKGFASLNSCDWGQIALGNYQRRNPETGQAEISEHAPFTDVLCQKLEANKNSNTITWQKLHDEVKQETATLFKQTYPNGRQVLALSGERVYQTTQDPIIVGELPRIPGENGPGPDDTPPPPPPPGGGAGRLGAAVQELPGPGVKIVRVEQNSPARSCIDSQGRRGQMETGDVILKVNGTPINTIDDLADALRKSPREASFDLKNVRDGSVITVRTQLRK